MSEDQFNGKLLVAVYDVTTGFIKQQTQCLRRDAEIQHHAWPGHDFVVLSTPVDSCKWKIDPATKQVVPRPELSDGERSHHEQYLAHTYRDEMQITHEHQTDMMKAVGGDKDAQHRTFLQAVKRDAAEDQHFRLSNLLKLATHKSHLSDIKWRNQK